jgi:hypothetical protein
MNISLPSPIQVWVENQASQSGKTAEEYVVQLLVEQMSGRRKDDAEAMLRESLNEGDSAQVSHEEVAAFKREIEARVHEALAGGPPVAVTPEFWEERRRVLDERLAALDE